MATEYKLPYTALDINRRLGKIDEIDSLKDLVGAEPVQKQISDAVKNIGEAIKTDTTLKVRGKAADAKAVGDAIANSKVEIDKTLKVSGKAADAKVTGDEITKLNNLVGDTPVADRIATAVEELAGNVYTHPDTHPASMITGLSGVATSGDYNDLSNLPEQYVHPESHPVSMITGLADVATSGNYEDLSNKPIIPEEYTHPETHPVDMITGLSDIAVSGDYADLKNKPTIPDEYVHPSTHSVDMITGLSGVAVSGDYNDLINKPDISGEYIHPESHPASMITGLANVAVSGNYEDLSNKPTIPTQYIHPDNHPASMITGLSGVATSGSYNDLTDKPTIPSIDGLATVAYVDEKFANVGESGGSGTSTGLPEFTTEDEGKVLSIKDGTPSWESVNAGFGSVSEVDLFPERVADDFRPLSSYGGLYGTGYNFPESGLTNDLTDSFELALGEIYYVEWDGVEYEVTPSDASAVQSGALFLGNGAPMGLPGNGEPFAVGWTHAQGVTFISIDQLESHTIRIYQKVETTSAISWNDLADKPFGEERGLVDLLPETTYSEFFFENNYGAYVANESVTYKLTVGETYTVFWDGQEHTCIAQDSSSLMPNTVCIGNASAFGLAGNNEPFVIAWETTDEYGDFGMYIPLVNAGESIPHTIRIAQEADIVNRLDNKYLDFMNVYEAKDIMINPRFPFDLVSENYESSGKSLYMAELMDTSEYGHFDKLTPGAKYEVIINDNVQIVTASEMVIPGVEGDFVFCGNKTLDKQIFGDDAENTYEDFLICVVKQVVDGAQRCAAAIYITTTDTHSGIGAPVSIKQLACSIIKKEYLPDDIGGGNDSNVGPALPEVSTSDAGKFLRVGADGNWIVEALQDVSEVGL